jgi:ribosomal protein S18 acetylase RimI-like enzyme
VIPVPRISPSLLMLKESLRVMSRSRHDQQYGFEFRKIRPAFYEKPIEDAVVMERRIDPETPLTES